MFKFSLSKQGIEIQIKIFSQNIKRKKEIPPIYQGAIAIIEIDEELAFLRTVT